MKKKIRKFYKAWKVWQKTVGLSILVFKNEKKDQKILQGLKGLTKNSGIKHTSIQKWKKRSENFETSLLSESESSLATHGTLFTFLLIIYKAWRNVWQKKKQTKKKTVRPL